VNKVLHPQLDRVHAQPSASLFICCSATKSLAARQSSERPFGYCSCTRHTCPLDVGMSYGPVHIKVVLPKTWCSYTHTHRVADRFDLGATSLPSFVAPHFALKNIWWRLWCAMMDSSRLQTILTAGPASRRQRQDYLHRHILAPANAPPWRIDTRIIRWQAERVRNLVLIFVRPLTATCTVTRPCSSR